jgi:hypothetical protein
MLDILKGLCYNYVMKKSPVFDFEVYFDKQYVGKTWAQVMEENEFFDGETEIEAAAKERWREANRRARARR